MKSMVQAKRWLTVLAGVSVLSLTACGGGGGSSGAASTTSGTGGGGTPTPATPAAVVAVQSQKLAAGVGYSLGVSSAGKVLPWGSGMHGAVNTVDAVAAVGTASWGTNLNASWAVTSNGDLLYWGDDAAGKLTANAVVLSGLGHVAAARACGSGKGAMLYVLKTDGSVWGVPARDLTDAAKGFAVTGVGQAKALGDGTDDTCSSMLAIDKDGGVWKLQTGTDATGIPTQAQGVAVAGLSDVIQASCAAANCLALTTNGAVMAWGSNDKGQLGDLTLDASSTPVAVDLSAFASNGVEPKVSRVLVTPGGAAYAVGAAGALYGWGHLDGWISAESPMYDGTSPVRLLSDRSSTQQIVSSPTQLGHTLVLFLDGAVYGWGNNTHTEVSSTDGSATLTIPTPTEKNLLQ